MNWIFASTFGSWIQTQFQHSWSWICRLDTQEWFLLLGIVAALGFLCMLGYGSRGNL